MAQYPKRPGEIINLQPTGGGGAGGGAGGGGAIIPKPSGPLNVRVIQGILKEHGFPSIVNGNRIYAREYIQAPDGMWRVQYSEVPTDTMYNLKTWLGY